MPRTITLSENIRPILGAIRTVPIPPKPGELPASPPPPAPFVTISREVGAGGWTLAQALVDALNESDPGEQPWTCWDRELVEKVASDFHLSSRLVESLGTAQHSWLSDFFASLSFSGGPDSADELHVFRKVASTVRALAQTGRIVLVGRGGVYLTSHMPGGLHVRLVAPLRRRIKNIEQLMSYTQAQAANYVREMIHIREAFYRRYFPHEPLRPDLFSVTINTAQVSQQASVRIIMDLLRDASRAGRKAMEAAVAAR